MKTFIIILVTVVVTILIFVGVGLAFKSKGKLSSMPATPVHIESPQRGELVEVINASGVIEPETQVKISARISAQVKELPFAESDKVTKGNAKADPVVEPSVLVRLDASDLEAKLQTQEQYYAARKTSVEVARTGIETQKANIQGVSSSLEQAQRELNRQEQLLQSHDVSQAQVDDTQSTVEQYQAQLAAAQHSLRNAELNLVISEQNLKAAESEITQARENLNYTTIKSPIDGTVTKIHTEVGETVTGTINNPGTVIIEVADLSQMILAGQVVEADIDKVKVGQKAKIHIQAWPEKIFDGTVSSVALTPSIDPRSGVKYFETEIMIANSDQQLFVGLTAEADIEIKYHKDIVKVPTQAVLGRKTEDLPKEIRDTLSDSDKMKTYTTVAYRYIDGKAMATPVKIGASDLTNTIILSGLTQEDKIVTGPYKILDGINHEQKIEDEDKDKNSSENKTTPQDANTTEKHNEGV